MEYEYENLSVDEIIRRIVDIWPVETVLDFLENKMGSLDFHVDSKNSKGYTALQMAMDIKLARIGAREYSVIEALLRFGADPLKRDCFGTTAAAKLMRKYCDSDLIIKCLEKIKDIDTRLSCIFSTTPLCEAIKIGDETVVKYILGRNPDVNVRTPECNTPLHMAAWKQNATISRWLLERKADVNAKDLDNETPMYRALNLSIPSRELINIFMEYKADLSVVTVSGKSLLHVICSCHKGIDLDICRLLLESGCDANCRDSGQNTPLFYAMKNKAHGDNMQHYFSLIRLFLEFGAHLNVRNLKGHSILDTVHKYKSSHSLQLISYLLYRGADSNIVNDEQEPFLNIIKDIRSPQSLQKFIAFLVLLETVKKFKINDALVQSIRSHEMSRDIETACKIEMDFIVENEIVENLSMKWCSLLICDEMKVAKFCRNDRIRLIMSLFTPHIFPHYGQLLKNNYESGLRRYKAESEGCQLLLTMSKGILPYDIVRHIISYIPTIDLEKFRR